MILGHKMKLRPSLSFPSLLATLIKERHFLDNCVFEKGNSTLPLLFQERRASSTSKYTLEDSLKVLDLDNKENFDLMSSLSLLFKITPGIPHSSKVCEKHLNLIFVFKGPGKYLNLMEENKSSLFQQLKVISAFP